MALIERSHDLTVASALTLRATTDPETAFVRSGEEWMTFGQLELRSEALAASMSELGIEAGDRVAILLPPCSEFLISMFAVAKLGGVIVPLNPSLTAFDLQYMLRHSEAVAVVTIETQDGVDYLQRFEDLFPNLPELQYLITVGEEDLWYDDRIFQFEDLLSAGGGRDFVGPEERSRDEVFAIIYTSGTTGKPKGVLLTHANLLQVASQTALAIGLSESDRVVGVTALFHVFGLGPGVLGSLLAGASLILVADHDIWDEEDPWRTIELIKDHDVTVHYGVPTLFVRAIQALERDPQEFPTLRLGVVAGAPLLPEWFDRIEAGLSFELLNAYSLTETASTVAVSRPEDSPEVRRGSVGQALDGVVVEVRDAEGQSLPVGEVGELMIRGDGVMAGYYRQPRETEFSLDPDGFFASGDLGFLDEVGRIYLVGRTKDVIIRGGFNVYPREVEAKVSGHPAVYEVVVVGVPDPVLGEAICACIVPEEGAIVTEAEIRDWCQTTLADYKIPDRVRFFDGFPMTETGKIRRVALVKAMESETSHLPL